MGLAGIFSGLLLSIDWLFIDQIIWELNKSATTAVAW
jgi:hypothetical protein